MVNVFNDNFLKKTFFIILAILICTGLAYLASAGIIDGQRKFDDAYFYVKRQIFQGLLIGGFGFVIGYFIPLNFLKKISPFILILSFVTLLALFIPSLAPNINGANRWLFIGPVGFQPAEFLKLSLVIYLSSVFSSLLSANKGELPWRAIITQLGILCVLSLLLVKQPDIGTLGVVALISFSLLYLSNLNIKHLLLMIATGLLVILVLSLTSTYRLNRIKAFFDRSIDSSSTSYHINQAILGVGSGGWLGLGYGRSVQKTKFLPEPVGDSIFAVIIEEGGFVAGSFIVFMIFALGCVVLIMASMTPGYFNSLLIYGFGSWIIFQSFVHISAITGILPLTGVPLPFISYGSSSTVALLTMAGLVLNAFNNRSGKIKTD